MKENALTDWLFEMGLFEKSILKLRMNRNHDYMEKEFFPWLYQHIKENDLMSTGIEIKLTK